MSEGNDMKNKRDYSYWQHALIRVDVMLAAFLSIAEVLIFIDFFVQRIIEQTLSDYIMNYMIIPSAIAWGLVLYLLIRHRGTHKRIEAPGVTNDELENLIYKENRRIISVLTGLCLLIAYVHYVFSITLVLACMPVLLSVVFYNVRLSKSITTLNEICIIIAGIHRYVSRGYEDKYILADMFVSMLTVGVTGYIAVMLIKQIIYQHKELTDAKEEAERANVTKSQFLTRMSHEIRTPINAVIGMDEMILRESNEDIIKGYAKDIKTSSRSLLEIVEEILDIEKIESGKMKIVPVEYSLRTMVLEVYNSVAIRANEKGLKLIIDVDNKLPSVLMGDVVRIKQIITYILSNAIKYTHVGTVTLKITGKTEGSFIDLTVSVKDSGVGIKPEEISKIKETFSEANDDNRVVASIGLGIGITNELLSLMKSKLEVESKYGVGSEFFFTLRQRIKKTDEVGEIFKDKNYALEEELKKTTDDWTAENKRVLVVDDSEIDLRVFCFLLKNRKIEIETAKSGMECLSRIKNTKYDIIFMDHVMNGMDGVEAFNEIKKIKEGPNYHTPVVMVTANAIVGAKESYLNQGFSAYISKPIEPEILDETTRSILEIE